MTRRDLPHIHPAEAPWQETMAHALARNRSHPSRPGPRQHGPFSLANREDMPAIWCPCSVPHQLWRHISQGADLKSP